MRLSLQIIVASLAGISFIVDAEQIVPDAAARRLDEIKSAEAIIEFYGQVLDQFSEPVEGAIVIINVDQATLLPTAPLSFRVITDAKGAFEVDGRMERIRGSSISIKTIEREGYEMQFAPGEKRGFDYRKYNPNRFTPNKANPVIFHMRKKAVNPAFLFQEMSLKFQIPAAESGKIIGFDFVQRGPIRDVDAPKGDDASRVTDIQIKATFDTNDATWAVVLSPGNTNGGILVSEQLLYEAPDTGYQPEYTFTPEDRKPVKAKYVYLKSRDPAIYTRLEIEHINANKDFFRLNGKSGTNPYGERNLEQATDLPYEVTKQLTDEAKASFRQNKRPVKPDLPKLVREAKARTENP